MRQYSKRQSLIRDGDEMYSSPNGLPPAHQATLKLLCDIGPIHSPLPSQTDRSDRLGRRFPPPLPSQTNWSVRLERRFPPPLPSQTDRSARLEPSTEKEFWVVLVHPSSKNLKSL
ncbi:hypothetical protein PGT21_029641 [Puccinia graminis f. sp. tritici]|uniref:Uncharacterized protein n=1 Tax=Puccinia graminis f. sp. tritici TaxID=56615 RepID=A0A5B0PLV4_PUCGR|nr:hypothetical protein PGT21_029641 [Puccinia graminis f. sp. tritici]